MFDGETGPAPTVRKFSSLVSSESKGGGDLASTLEAHNRKLMADGAVHRWVVRNGKPESVTVLEPVFSERDAQSCQRVTGYREAKRARCNGDGTVSEAYWSPKHRDWLWN